MKKEIRIKQRKDDCHYEMSFEESMFEGWMPIAIGYGVTQVEADTQAIQKFIKLNNKK